MNYPVRLRRAWWYGLIVLICSGVLTSICVATMVVDPSWATIGFFLPTSLALAALTLPEFFTTFKVAKSGVLEVGSPFKKRRVRYVAVELVEFGSMSELIGLPQVMPSVLVEDGEWVDFPELRGFGSAWLRGRVERNFLLLQMGLEEAV